jgi:hypothetical protein
MLKSFFSFDILPVGGIGSFLSFPGDHSAALGTVVIVLKIY